MAGWRNATGRPLSSPAWLDAHHKAKLPERGRFARELLQYRPRRLVDLGCATGLWLDLLDKILPADCEFVGLDSDRHALGLAKQRASSWPRPSEFVLCDIVSEPKRIPPADLALAFNVFSYLPNVSELLAHLEARSDIERLVIRQYDGGTIRIGPMSADDRYAVDSSLRASLESSTEFSYYDMDRTYEALRQSAHAIERIEFELTERHPPFPPEFMDFFQGTIEWMSGLLSDDARSRLDRALVAGERTAGGLYFEQVDLVAVLSAAR